MDQTQLKILVIEDHKPFRDVLVKVLSLSRYQVISADYGQTGLTMARNEKPDAIILDVMMPGMDGYETCRQLRAMPEMARTPIIMLTALAGDDIRTKAQETGADAFLTKPCAITELEAEIIKHVKRRREMGGEQS